jgi:hypothetical protein
MTVTCDIALHDRDKMTSRYIDRHKDGTITVWPTWTGKEDVSLRLNAAPEKLAELRDLINSALRHHENVRASERCHHSLTALADEPAELEVCADKVLADIERLDAEGDAMAGERFDGQG